jgi:signal transduction protein with GAF and PtsI domain
MKKIFICLCLAAFVLSTQSLVSAEAVKVKKEVKVQKTAEKSVFAKGWDKTKTTWKKVKEKVSSMFKKAGKDIKVDNKKVKDALDKAGKDIKKDVKKLDDKAKKAVTKVKKDLKKDKK